MKISGGLLALASLGSLGARSVLAQSEDPDQVWPIHDNGLNQVVRLERTDDDHVVNGADLSANCRQYVLNLSEEAIRGLKHPWHFHRPSEICCDEEVGRELRDIEISAMTAMAKG